MADTTKKNNIKTVMGYMGWVIIYSAVVLGVGFYYGSQSQVQAQKDTQKQIEQAVKAVAPAPVPKS